MKKKSVLMMLILVLSLEAAYALELEEKLTVRFLKVSNSKKTVLVNRGIEDGLVVGDHARFFQTTGVIARGVVVKASPTRSIWSIYRVVDNEEIYPDKAANIKITNMLKITDDPSRALLADNNFSDRNDVTLAIPGSMTDVTNESLLNADERAELARLTKTPAQIENEKWRQGVDRFRTWEVWGTVHISNLTSDVDSSNDNTVTGNLAEIDFSVGIEKYFKAESTFFSSISVFLLFHSTNNSSQSIQGQEIDHTINEWGGGLSFHFLSPALSYGRPIAYITGGGGISYVSDTARLSTAGGESITEETIDGRGYFGFFGVGLKYFTETGFGMRASLDYYRRVEEYDFSANGTEYSKDAYGPRFIIGLSYRF